MRNRLLPYLSAAPIAAACLILASCGGESKPAPETKSEAKPLLTQTDFGKMPDGTAVTLYTLTNKNGVAISVMTYGATVQSIKAPDAKGQIADVVLGFDNLAGYLGTEPYFGAVVGRYGNRIAKGHFKLDGQDYHMAINNPPNSLHGGLKGFDKVLWTGRDASSDAGPAVEFSYLSKDGEEGYPGNLTVKVKYTLTAANEVHLDYSATTDKTTVTNITNHTYFNLNGAGNGDILGEQLTLNASHYTPVDAGLIPTGVLEPVANTPFDFTKPAVIGSRINQAGNQQLKFAGGYDHNWVIDHTAPGALGLAAKVVDPVSGRVLEVLTTQPGVQFYTGNFLDGTITGKGGKVYGKRAALCLETQHFPDSPNHPAFPTTTLMPGATMTSSTVWKFSTNP